MNSSKQGINIHCPNCGFSFEIFDLDLPAYNCPNCDYEITMRAKDEEPKLADTKTFVGKIENTPMLKPGADLGGFELKNEIGRGGMGVVYKAMQKSLSREVALKILPEHLSADPEFIKRFQREAQALATLTHPNIVSILDRCEVDGVYFFVMEYVSGKSLRQIMRNRRLNLTQVLSIIADICNGLSYAHSRGIIHRDIKPENILIDTNGVVKITDFGLSRILRKDSEFSRITNTAITMGTLDYMSPEQRISSKSADHRSDIYAVGVMMYELLTNEIPVGNFEKPSNLEPTLPPVIDEIIMKALKSNSTDRFQTITQMKEQIDSVIEDVKNWQNQPQPKQAVPFAKPMPQVNPWTHANRSHWDTERFKKQKGFSKTFFSYEFIIVMIIVGFILFPFIVPVFVVMLIIRIFMGDSYDKPEKVDQPKQFASNMNSQIKTEFSSDPVAAGVDKTSTAKAPNFKEFIEDPLNPEKSKGFFKDMKKQIKQKYKEVKKQIQADLKQYVRSDSAMSKEEIEAEIDKRVQVEVDQKLSFEIERIRREEQEKKFRFGMLSIVSIILIFFAAVGVSIIGGYMFTKEYTFNALYQLDLVKIQDIMEWVKYAGGALLFSMFLFSALTSSACKKLRKYGHSMALIAMFFTLMSSFFWYHEWKEVTQDINAFHRIENSAQTNPKEAAKDLKSIVHNPTDYHTPASSVRFMAIKMLFNNDTKEFKEIIAELKNSSSEHIRDAWIRAAKASRTKSSLDEISTLLNDKSDEVVRETMTFIMDKYPEKGWATIKEHYVQLSFENKKWLIGEIGKRKPAEMLGWLIESKSGKLESQFTSAITKYRTISIIPYFADQLFSEKRLVRHNAFNVLKTFPKDNVLAVFIEYIKSGTDAELREEIVDFLEDSTDFDGDEDNFEEWESWLIKRHAKTYDEINSGKIQIDALMKNVGSLNEIEQITVEKMEVLTNSASIYTNLCKVLTVAYDMQLKVIDTLAPEKYERLNLTFENDLSLAEFIERIENILSTMEKRYPEIQDNDILMKEKQECERKRFRIEQRSLETFEK